MTTATVAFVEAESFAQDPAPSDLAHRRRDAWVRQDGSSAGGPSAVAARDATLANLNAIAGGLADQVPFRAQEVSHQACDDRLPVRAGDSDHGDAAVFAGGKQVVDDGLTDRPRCPDGRLQMRVQTRTGIHLHDRSGLFFQGTADVLGDDVEPRDVQADHACRFDCPSGHVPDARDR